jgi:protein SCO1/2
MSGTEHQGTKGTRLIVAIGTLALALALSIAARSMRSTALPVYGPIPDFRLVDERGLAKDASSMHGQVSVVDFIFTRCTSSCPRLTARMLELQSRLEREKSDARLVSISVDPDNDTPAVLSEYAARVHADSSRWSFLTGDEQEVERAVVLGFKVSAAKIDTGAGTYDVIHGDWFVLVDRRGRLRGYYPTIDLQGQSESMLMGALVKDVLRLEREK